MQRGIGRYDEGGWDGETFLCNPSWPDVITAMAARGGPEGQGHRGMGQRNQRSKSDRGESLEDATWGALKVERKATRQKCRYS